MTLWQYREWAGTLPNHLRARVDVMLDVIEALLPLEVGKSRLPDDLGERVGALLTVDSPHVWVVLLERFPDGGARVVGVFSTEVLAADFARRFARDCRAGVIPWALTPGGTLGVQGETSAPGGPHDVYLSWDEYPVQIGGKP